MTDNYSIYLKQRSSSPPPLPYFNPHWEYLYLFTQIGAKSKCLVCHRILTNVRKFNMKRHYAAYHEKEYERLEGSERAAEVEKLKANVYCCSSEAVEEESEEEIIPGPPVAFSRLKRSDKEQDPLQTIQSTSWADSDTDIIARSWAVQLAQAPPDQQLFAQKAINDILFEARMKTLHRDSVVINRPCNCSSTNTSMSVQPESSKICSDEPEFKPYF